MILRQVREPLADPQLGAVAERREVVGQARGIGLEQIVKCALNLVIWLTILMALLSWLNPRSPAMPLLYQLTAPFLNPLRRVLPQLGGIDLSPILLFVIVQILLMVVTRAAVSLTLFGI